MPERLLSIIIKCLASDTKERPTMSVIYKDLEKLEGDLITEPDVITWKEADTATRVLETVFEADAMAIQAVTSNSGLISFSW